MLVRQKCLGFGLVICVLGVASTGGSLVYGQGTFLEKLEEAVRTRLLETDSPASGSPSEEELPTPKGKSSPGGSLQGRGEAPQNRTTSILDGRPNSPIPSGAPVPPPPEDAGLDGGTPAPVGRIYLGLEAEEITGGGIGVRVSKVTEGSPAWKSGFQTGDRISAVNGFAIANLDSMVEQLGKSAPGETVRFLVNRNDRNIELVSVLMDAGLASRIAGGPLPVGQRSEGDLPPAENNLPLDAMDDEGGLDSPPWLGVIVNDLTPDFRRQFGLTVFRGAAVTSVTANSPTSKIGLMAGDAIIAIGGVPIETARDLSSWMSTARPGQTVEVTYQRGSTSRTAPLTLEVNPQMRLANQTPVPEPSRQRANRSSGVAVVPAPPVPGVAAEDAFNVSPSTTFPGEGALTNEDVVPNAIPSPATHGSAPEDAAAEELLELRREVIRLRSDLEKANKRLESTQNRIKLILEGLGKE